MSWTYTREKLPKFLELATGNGRLSYVKMRRKINNWIINGERQKNTFLELYTGLSELVQCGRWQSWKGEMLVFPCRLKYTLNRKLSRHPLRFRAVLRVGHNCDFFYSCHTIGDIIASIQAKGLVERAVGCIPGQERKAGNCLVDGTRKHSGLGTAGFHV